jgi:hypothetical protein
MTGQPSTDTFERTRTRLGELADLSLRLLPEMYDENTGLFSHKTWIEDGRYVNREPNLLYSTVSVMGILRQRRKSPDEVIPVGRALDALHSAAALNAPPNAVGNLLAACAEAEDPRAEVLVAQLADAADRGTLPFGGLGNALHGLACAAERFPNLRDRARRAADHCAERLLDAFIPSVDLFRMNIPGPKSPMSTLQAFLTSFAGQVYPLHGLTAYYRLTGDAPPEAMSRVADRIVEEQGPLGQWWWIYSTRSRDVLQGYPVYSVHQDGMAFIALAPFGELGLRPYDEALGLGLDWLYGANELGVSLVEEDPPLIPRCIQRKGSEADGIYGISRAGFARVIAGSLRPASVKDAKHESPDRLEVLRECRSYHLGWLLCAHALTERAVAGANG